MVLFNRFTQRGRTDSGVHACYGIDADRVEMISPLLELMQPSRLDSTSKSVLHGPSRVQGVIGRLPTTCGDKPCGLL